jgi:hypothetical protein
MRKMRLTLTNQSYVTKSAAELLYILRDAREAADAMRGFDPKAEAKYLEQIDDAASVLAALRRGEQ